MNRLTGLAVVWILMVVVVCFSPLHLLFLFALALDDDIVVLTTRKAAMDLLYMLAIVYPRLSVG